VWKKKKKKKKKGKKDRRSRSRDRGVDEKYFCDVCQDGRTFSTHISLKKHMKNHEGRNFRCPFPGCLMMFHDQNKLKRHSITHTGEKPFKCDICGKRFGLEFNMKIHRRIHSGEKPYICSFPGCMRGFNQRTNL
jgi:uncharacterized Zn-finger protein